MARAAGAVGHGQAGPPPGGPQQRPATVDDADGQAASSPRGQQHVSTGHEDLQEGDADAPTHTPAEDPPQPNHPQRPRQDTPDTRSRTPNPTTQRSTTRTRHPRSQARQRAPPVLTTNKYRSREQQVPFSRAISTVLTEGRTAAPTSPHPAPTRRGQTVRLQASSEPSSAGSPSQGRPAPLPGVSARFASSASASPDQPPPLSGVSGPAGRDGGAPGRRTRPGTVRVRAALWRPPRGRLPRGPPLRARAAPTASHPCQAGGRRPPPRPDRPRPGRPRPRQASRSRPRSRRRPDPASSPPP